MSHRIISRRRLLATGINASAALAMAGALGPVAARGAAAAGASEAIPTFYDTRFPAARRRALLLPGKVVLRPIGGDPTALLPLLSAARGPVRLQGVTTESIPFCLREFAGRGPGVRLDCRRVDRDLFVWTLTLGAEPAAATGQPT